MAVSAEEVRQAFRLFDRDGNGRIDRAEIINVMRATGKNPSRKQVDELLKKYDSNKSEMLEFDEFAQLYADLPPEYNVATMLHAAFKLFDRNGDGKISVDELTYIMCNIGDEPLSEAEGKHFEQLLRQFDKDGNGTLDYTEFVDMMTTPIPNFHIREPETQADVSSERKTDGRDTATVPQLTFAFIKPDVVARGDDKKMLDAITGRGFEIVHKEKKTLTKKQAEEFYAEHKERPFFRDLVAFMTSGPVIALALHKNNAVKEWRAALGPTNSTKAKEEAPESLRALFGTDGQKNAGHGSDSVESARRELRIVFPDKIFRIY